jgi:hypothetical protein
VFATGGGLTNPDDITTMGGRIFVVWQNSTQPDGSGPGTSTVVAYRNNGKPSGTCRSRAFPQRVAHSG